MSDPVGIAAGSTPGRRSKLSPALLFISFFLFALLVPRPDVSAAGAPGTLTCPDGRSLKAPAIELYHLQDLTHSFRKDLLSFRTTLSDVLQKMYWKYPRSRFALGSFKDKSIKPLGDYHDQCYEHHKDFSASPHSIINALAKEVASAGGDSHQSQLDAVSYTLMSGWESDAPTVDEDGNRIIRWVTLATNARYHSEGDGRKFHPVEVHDPWTPFTSNACTLRDYPSAEVIQAELKHTDAKLLFLPSDRFKSVYERLADSIDVEGQVFVESYESDAQTIADIIDKAVTAEMCKE